MLTGDILIGRRFSGEGAEQMILSGGLANHAAMILTDDFEENPQGWRYVMDCPPDLGLGSFGEEGGVRVMELNEWLR